MRRLARTSVLLAFSALAGPAKAQEWKVRATLEVPFPVATSLTGNVDDERGGELVLLGHRGEVHVWKGKDASIERATLEAPERALVTLAPLATEESRAFLLVCGRGVQAYDLRGGEGASAVRRLSRGARFPFRTDVPRACDFARDLDGDGFIDLVIPGRNAVELWSQTRDEQGSAEFRRTSRFDVEVRREESLEARRLSDQLSVSYSVPELDLRDIDADGLEDLVVEDDDRITFYRQRADSGLPASPDLVLELDHFRDTTPEAGVRLGEAVQGERKPRAVLRDLDGDGRLDFVVFHLRKIQVYLGGEHGPQQERPTQILRVAEDITRIELANLDDDSHPDLMLVRVEVPTVATLIGGLFAEWDIGITILDYRGLGSAGFEKQVRRRLELTLRLPAIASLITQMDEYVARMEEAGRKLRTWKFADVDGDGVEDVAIVSEDQSRLDLWLGTGTSGESDEADQLFKEILFEGGDPVWTIDRMLALLGDLASRRALRMTGGRDPNASLPLRSPEEFASPTLDPIDFDGDGRHELLVTYERLGAVSERTVDVVGWR